MKAHRKIIIMAASLALLSPAYSSAESYNIATDDSSNTNAEDASSRDKSSKQPDSSSDEGGYMKKDLSRLKRLASTKITSVSKKPEDLFTAPAAVYVITSEDIKRSGATTVAEALRLVPGMDVARAGSNWWAISARGFNDTTSNKLLVMIDGRTVYNTLFSGVWWDSQDVLMEDIRRIEVIRGSGATLWGANAVNGVVNIITEDAGNTIGKKVTVTAGNAENIVTGRVGGNISDKAQYRLYAKHSDRDSFRTVTGGDAKDGWDIGQTGFRVDWDKTDHDLITFQGDVYIAI